MYGWRGRIGLLATAINTVMEPEFWQLVPPACQRNLFSRARLRIALSRAAARGGLISRLEGK